MQQSLARAIFHLQNNLPPTNPTDPTQPAYSTDPTESNRPHQVFSIDATSPDEVRPRITPVQRLSTLPPDWSGLNYVGEIKISASGRHVYVSNRGHDSIATFAVDPATGALARTGVDAARGACPRHFGLSFCGRFAVVGVQDSDAVKVFRLCPQSGRLADCIQELDAPTPNFVLIVKPHAGARAAAAFARAAEAARECVGAGAGGSRGGAVMACAR
jgi:hypothetical protein